MDAAAAAPRGVAEESLSLVYFFSQLQFPQTSAIESGLMGAKFKQPHLPGLRPIPCDPLSILFFWRFNCTMRTVGGGGFRIERPQTSLIFDLLFPSSKIVVLISYLHHSILLSARTSCMEATEDDDDDDDDDDEG